MCHRSVGLIQRGIEAAGIPTVSVTHLPRVTAKLGLPRAVQVPWPLGQAFGPAGAVQTHRELVQLCLELLHEPAPAPLVRYVPTRNLSRT